MKKQDMAYQKAIEHLREEWSDGEVHYCPPQILFEYEGKEYRFNTYDINRFHILAENPGLNYYQLRPVTITDTLDALQQCVDLIDSKELTFPRWFGIHLGEASKRVHAMLAQAQMQSQHSR